MKLKTLSRIDRALATALAFVAAPFRLLQLVFGYASRAMELVVDWLNSIAFKAGNRLLRASEEVKSGAISESHYLKYWTAKGMYSKQKRKD